MDEADLVPAPPRPLEARVALTPRRAGELFSHAWRVLHGALAATGDTLPSAASTLRDARVLAVTAAVETLTRQHLAGPALPEPLTTLRTVAAPLLQP